MQGTPTDTELLDWAERNCESVTRTSRNEWEVEVGQTGRCAYGTTLRFALSAALSASGAPRQGTGACPDCGRAMVSPQTDISGVMWCSACGRYHADQARRAATPARTQ